MVAKVNGGIPNEFQNLTGHLTYLEITGTTIGNNALDHTDPAAPVAVVFDPTNEYHKIDPNSEAAKVQAVLQGRSTVVIYRADSATTIFAAVENAGDAWFENQAPDIAFPGPHTGATDPTLEADLLAAGINATVKLGDFAVATAP